MEERFGVRIIDYKILAVTNINITTSFINYYPVDQR